MSFIDRILPFRRTLTNIEPNIEEEVGIGFETGSDTKSVDLADKVDFEVKRTIKNCRFAANDPSVQGILLDNITKTNSVFVIQSEDSKALEFIKKKCIDWDIKQLMDDMLFNGIVDGEGFIHKMVVDNQIKIRHLAFDAETYRIKRKYNEYGEVVAYKQLTTRDKEKESTWIKKDFNQLSDKLEDNVEVNFTADELINYKYVERKGKGRSLVMNILDQVYYLRSIERLMPTTVYKNSNIMVLTVGNEHKSGLKLSQTSKKDIVESATDYHKKGVIMLPYGVESKMLGTNQLPSVDNYIKLLEHRIFTGLTTPDVIFSSESSNRSTAEVQLDSPETGRQLMFKYNREWLKKYLEEELFKPQLELAGYDPEVSKVWIEFNPKPETGETGAYMEDEDQESVNLEENNTTTNDEVAIESE